MSASSQITVTELPECEFRTKIKRWRNGCSIKCLTKEGTKTVTVWKQDYSGEKLLWLLCCNCPEYLKVKK